MSDAAYLSVDAEGMLCDAPEGERLLVSLTIGKVYEVTEIDEGWDMYRLVDDTGEDYLFPKDRFRIVDP